MIRFFLSLFLSCPTVLMYAAIPLKAQIGAKGAVLINAETGAILYGKNPSSPLYPASTTKVFTAYYALEKCGSILDAQVTASKEAMAIVTPAIRRASNGGHPPYRLEHGGTHMALREGEVISLRTLLYGLMLNSGNDAANVIAECVSGSVPQFIEELNAFARLKGCENTLLYTPHGLPHPDHVTTPYDLAIFTSKALKNPGFRQIVKTLTYPRGQTNKQAPTTLVQHNALLKPGKFYYPKAIGVKSGFTNSAGFCLVSAAEDSNRKLVAVLLGCESRDQVFQNTIALFEAAFNERKMSRRLFSKGFDVFSCAVDGAKSTLEAQLAEDLTITYYPSEEPSIKPHIRWQTPSLPIAAGARVGEMQILTQEDSKLLFSLPLFAVKPVQATLGYRMHLKWEIGKGILRNCRVYLLVCFGAIFMLATFYFFHLSKEKKV